MRSTSTVTATGRCLLLAWMAASASACAGLTATSSHGMRVLPVGAAVQPMVAERSSFEVPLFDAAGKQFEPKGQSRGSAVLSMRPDNVLEYQIQIRNSSGETFTQAHVVRLAPDSSLDVVATLFADVMMRGARISVRGTASLSRSVPPDALLAQVREHPERYRVVIRGERRPDGALSGPLSGR